MFEEIKRRFHRVVSPGPGSESYARGVLTDPTPADVALVALLRRRPGGRGWPELTAEIVERGDPVVVWSELTDDALVPDPTNLAALDTARRDLREWSHHGLRFVSILDSDFPAALRDIHQAPPFLFAAGELRAEDPAVSVVGSRAATYGGLRQAAQIARGLADLGITVVAGLAAGIDGAAYRAAWNGVPGPSQ